MTSWVELFGKKGSEMAREQRKKNWEKFKADNPEIASEWEEYHECHDCDQRTGNWCNLQSLPCFYNPILTRDTSVSGMACMGLYKSDDCAENTAKQLEFQW